MRDSYACACSADVMFAVHVSQRALLLSIQGGPAVSYTVRPNLSEQHVESEEWESDGG